MKADIKTEETHGFKCKEMINQKKKKKTFQTALSVILFVTSFKAWPKIHLRKKSFFPFHL